MTRTTPPRPLDLTAVFPELATMSRNVTRLHPRSGSPTIEDSSLGGPLLWPQNEPWPTCTRSHEVYEVEELETVRASHHLSVARWAQPDDERQLTFEEQAILDRDEPKKIDSPYAGPVPLLPVAQLYARDVPGLPCPDDADLMQILWCPFMDHDDEFPAIHVRWRRADEVTAVLSPPPEPTVIERADYWPAPCVLHPEQASEYPAVEQLPAAVGADIRARVDAWQEETGHYYVEFAVAPGWKVGGWGVVSSDDRDSADPPCCECGSLTEPLFTIGLSEWNGHDAGGWRPIEDTDADDRPGYPPVGDPTGIELGDEQLQVYRCAKSYEHPPVTERVYRVL
ncbi:hypothetical protein ACKI1I_01860 [Streptomyces turgidiscabies]|uniref:DUF1963 domain-containing protein n=1 Tax=Streptomyces turgidiscabies (strain Car8) TaxID=698760 RepID=L7F7D4_STRT8|nr:MULTISPECIES: hypothetical protein [Streptomyces]ELP66966.1 hypothetical protein STRTUCAR8_05323 [Streptomyces turgidiscabies Car8]MDX3492358.1 hypothetical protein [Streptomyces turgidiscabies]GAQ69349.1 hypothetical protein T45_01073 [Streptomyces turgidiscabies]